MLLLARRMWQPPRCYNIKPEIIFVYVGTIRKNGL